jgi:hypothetical protein
MRVNNLAKPLIYAFFFRHLTPYKGMKTGNTDSTASFVRVVVVVAYV